MMIPITPAHVEVRFATFVAKYAEALTTLKFPAPYIEDSVGNLKRRLTNRDFKRYGTHPVHDLHAGKRITRYLIRLAIENSPAERARRDKLQERYREKCAEIRQQRGPLTTFFSFEAACAKQLKVALWPYKAMFRI